VSITKVDSALLSRMFLAGAGKLESQKEYINELNVFPVPDGDTGTNMTMTIMSAAGEVAALEDVNMKSVSKAISSGSLRGARGNSGVILSQLLRGFSRTIAEHEELDVKTASHAFSKAVETAYKAVMKPKEGTILTVAREAAEEAVAAASDTDDFEEFSRRILDKAKEALDNTPNQLPVLKEAGVVDSGGTGLFMVLSGAYDCLMGKEVSYEAAAPVKGAAPIKISAETEAEIKFGYCTEFIIVLNQPLKDAQIDEFKEFLNGIGDSIVFVPDDEIIKVHVHTNNPGTVLQKALSHGSLSRIKIDNMREEHQERLFKDSMKLAEEQKKKEEAKKAEQKPIELKQYGFVSVSIGEGVNQIFRDLGVDEVIAGGQTMNPSTDDILQAVERIPAKTVYILPNNKNIILAANQVIDLIEDKEVIIIPSKSIPQGITALINFIPEDSPAENAQHMTEGIGMVKTGELTYAVRNTSIDGTEIREGDYMAIDDNGISSVGPEMNAVIDGMFDAMVDEDSEIITLYYGEEVSEEEAQHVAERVEERYPDCEVEVYNGGQPIYYYVVSVE
jgi:uncharacterized protein